jgi:hypothetical protein
MTAHDLVITGGTVIDPRSGLHDRCDVAIADDAQTERSPVAHRSITA